MKLKEIKQEADILGERIDKGLSTDRVAVWLCGIVKEIIKYLEENKQRR